MDLVFDRYDPADEARRGSLLGLGNGRLFIRAWSPEAGGRPGTTRAGCYDRLIHDTERGRCLTEALAELPAWPDLRVRIAGGTWLSPARHAPLDYRHGLDLGQGLAIRRLRLDDGGRRVALAECRLVSMAAAERAALRLEMVPEGWSGRLEIRAAIACPDDLLIQPSDAMPDDVLLLRARTRRFGIDVAMALKLSVVEGQVEDRRVDRLPDGTAELVTCAAADGRTVAVELVAALVTGCDPAVGDPAEAALASARVAPAFDVIREAHAAAWTRLWDRAAFEAGNPELARATRLHAFHVLQTASPHTVHLDAGFPARGWQRAYGGQVFWDDILVFPFLAIRFPDLARALLLYRYRRLDAARAAARQAGYRGAMFPWRSASTGAEVTPGLQRNGLTGRWMRDETRRQRHVGSAIAINLWRYHLATGDAEFLSDYGAELLIEIARFWASIAERQPGSDRWSICGVIGPDEYHDAYPGAAEPGLDDNAYTNVMAAWTLRRALAVLDALPRQRHDELQRSLGVGGDEPALWAQVADRLALAFHDGGVLSQFRGFERLKPMDGRAFAERYPDGRVDWMLDARGDSVNAYQVTKQADVLTLFHLFPPPALGELVESLGYAFGPAEMRRTVDAYLDRMTHESSLSRVICAGALATLDRAQSWAFFTQAMQTDLDPGHSTSTEDGLHMGALAGTIDVLQRHYLGLDFDEAGIRLAPHPPPALGPVRFGFHYHGGAYELAFADGRLRLSASDENRHGTRVALPDGEARLEPSGTVETTVR